MSKKKIEEEFLSYLVPLIENEGFVLVKKQLTGEHLVSFKKKILDVEFDWTLLFHRYGKVVVYFQVSYDKTKLLLDKYMIGESVSYDIFSLSINVYINPECGEGIIGPRWGIDSPHSDDLMNGVNLEKAANGIFTELFKKPVPKLIDRLGTLEKADKLLNEAPTVDLGKQEFEWLVYSPNKVFQLMSSLLVGKVVERKNLSELAEMYLEYISDIEPGARSDVDAIRSIIPKLVV